MKITPFSNYPVLTKKTTPQAHQKCGNTDSFCFATIINCHEKPSSHIAFKGWFGFFKDEAIERLSKDRDFKNIKSKNIEKALKKEDLSEFKSKMLRAFNAEDSISSVYLGFENEEAFAQNFIDSYLFIHSLIKNDTKMDSKKKEAFYESFNDKTISIMGDRDHREAVVAKLATQTDKMTDYETKLMLEFCSSVQHFVKDFSPKMQTLGLIQDIKTPKECAAYVEHFIETNPDMPILKKLRTMLSYPQIDHKKFDRQILNKAFGGVTNLIEAPFYNIPYTEENKDDYNFLLEKMQDSMAVFSVSPKRLQNFIDEKNIPMIKLLQKRNIEAFNLLSNEDFEKLRDLKLPVPLTAKGNIAAYVISNGFDLNNIKDIKTILSEQSLNKDQMVTCFNDTTLLSSLINIPYNEKTKEDFEFIAKKLAKDKLIEGNVLEDVIKKKNLAIINLLQKTSPDSFNTLPDESLKKLRKMTYPLSLGNGIGLKAYLLVNGLDAEDLMDIKFLSSAIINNSGFSETDLVSSVNGFTVLDSLLDIPYNDKTKDDFEKITKNLSKFKNFDWAKEDQYRLNITKKAITAENIAMINLMNDICPQSLKGLSSQYLDILKKLDTRAKTNSNIDISTLLYINNIKEEDLYDIKTYFKLLDNPNFEGKSFNETIDGCSTLFDCLLDIPYTKENKQDFNAIAKKIDKLEGIDYLSLVDTYKNNLAIKAALSENVPLLKLFHNNEVSFEQKNIAKLNAKTIIEQSKNKEFVNALSGIKFHSDALLSVTKEKNYAGVKVFINDKLTDMNSKDENGDTPWLIAVKHCSFEVLDVLAQDSRVDKKITDKNGDNIMSLLFLGLPFDTYDSKKIIEFLSNTQDVDLAMTYEGKTTQEHLNDIVKSSSNISDIKKAKSKLEDLNLITANRFFKKTAEIATKNGKLELEQIEHFVNSPFIKLIVNEEFNDKGKAIGDYLVDIVPHKNNITEILDILTKLNIAGYYFMRSTDSYAQKKKNRVVVDFIEKNYLSEKK